MTLASDIAQIAADTVIFHDVVNGDASETVMTESGAVDTLAAAISKIGAVNYRDDWAALTAYAIGDAVAWYGALYRCIIAHTSGNNVVLGPTQDAADWVVQNAQPANVTNAQMAGMAQATVKGRAAGAGTGKPADLTQAQLTALVDNLTLAQLADQPTSTFVGRSTAGTGAPEAITAAQAAAIIAPSLLTGLRNKIINGCFRKWDYGTSQTSSGYGSANRWNLLHSISTKTVSRQSFTPGQTSVPGEPLYFLRTVVTSAANTDEYVVAAQNIESARTFSGKTATISFYAKADSSKNIAVEVLRSYGTGGSPSSPDFAIIVTTCALTTNWQKFTITVSIPSISGKTLGTNGDDYLGIAFWFDAGSATVSRTNSLGNQSGTFDIADVRMVEGTIGDTEALIPIGMLDLLCARFLPAFIAAGTEDDLGLAWAVSATAAAIVVPLGIARIPPTGISISSAGHFDYKDISATRTASAVTFGSASRYFARVTLTVSGATAGNSGRVVMNNASGKLLFTGCEI